MPKCNLYLCFLIYQNLLISGEKMLMSAELKGCVTWFIYTLDILSSRYNCAKFHHCWICVTNFRVEWGDFLPPPIHEQPQKGSSWIGLIWIINHMINSESTFLFCHFVKVVGRSNTESRRFRLKVEVIDVITSYLFRERDKA